MTAARSPDGGRVEARVFVNAAGPWAEEVAALAGVGSVRLSLRKSVHWIVPGPPPEQG